MISAGSNDLARAKSQCFSHAIIRRCFGSPDPSGPPSASPPSLAWRPWTEVPHRNVPWSSDRTRRGCGWPVRARNRRLPSAQVVWWKSPRPPPTSAGYRPCARTTRDHSTASDTASRQCAHLSPLDITDEPSSEEGIALATSDPSLPVLEIRYAAMAFGANSGVDLVRHLLLDLRGPVPRLMALLDDVGGSIGGVCGQTLSTYTPDGLDLPRFDVRRISDNETFVVVQLTVTEGTGHGVYVIGLELKPGAGLRADALLVATDAAERGECNSQVFPSTAISMTTRSAPFTVTLDVEPVNVQNGLSGEITRAEGQPGHHRRTRKARHQEMTRGGRRWAA